MCLYYGVIGEKSITHGTAPPFPLSTASRQAEYVVRLYCASVRFFLRFPFASSARSNTKRLPPASVPAAGQVPRQEGSYLKVPFAPDRERISFAIVRGQIFKGDFPFPPCRQHTGRVKGRMANNNPAIGIMSIADMFLIGFVFSHGNSPLITHQQGQTGLSMVGAVHSSQPIHLPLTGSAGFAIFLVSYILIQHDCSYQCKMRKKPFHQEAVSTTQIFHHSWHLQYSQS